MGTIRTSPKWDFFSFSLSLTWLANCASINLLPAVSFGPIVKKIKNKKSRKKGREEGAFWTRTARRCRATLRRPTSSSFLAEVSYPALWLKFSCSCASSRTSAASPRDTRLCSVVARCCLQQPPRCRLPCPAVRTVRKKEEATIKKKKRKKKRRNCALVCRWSSIACLCSAVDSGFKRMLSVTKWRGKLHWLLFLSNLPTTLSLSLLRPSPCDSFQVYIQVYIVLTPVDAR